jgi:hypothetical protein
MTFSPFLPDPYHNRQDSHLRLCYNKDCGGISQIAGAEMVAGRRVLTGLTKKIPFSLSVERMQ